MSSRLYVIHIPRRFSADEWGGSETFIAEAGKRLQLKGYRTAVMTSKALNRQASDHYGSLDIRRYSYFYPYLGLSAGARQQLDKKAGNLFSFSLLFALLSMKRPDILHLHTGKRLGGIARFAARMRDIPYVITLHGGKLAVPVQEQESWVEPTKGAFEWGRVLGLLVGSRRVLEDAAAIICVGRDEYEAVKARYPGKPVHYLPNGVDTGRFSRGYGTAFRRKYGIPEQRFLVLTSARLDRQKNQLEMIRQLGAHADLPDIHLLLLGAETSAAYRQEIEELVAACGLTERVTIIPGIPYDRQDLVDAYHAADLFVLPSLHEPFGMVVVEAWAAGLPVAASDRGGLSALVEPGTGLLFDPEDGHSIADTILQLQGSKELREALARQGKSKAMADYSWDTVTDRLVEIYRSVTGR